MSRYPEGLDNPERDLGRDSDAEVIAWAAEHLDSKSLGDTLEPGDFTVQQVYWALSRTNVPLPPPNTPTDTGTCRLLADLARSRLPSGKTLGSGTLGTTEA